jgi:hypothetical protein
MPERNSTPRGFSIFCDDIREETNNKFSYIGVYNGVLVTHAPFPFTLSKFCIAVAYMQSPDDEVRPLKLKLLMDRKGEKSVVVLEGDIDAEPFEQLAPPDPLFSDPMRGANLNIVLSPLTFDQECVLKVRAYYGDEEIKLGALLVRSDAPAEPLKA